MFLICALPLSGAAVHVASWETFSTTGEGDSSVGAAPQPRVSQPCQQAALTANTYTPV